jgi:hypothetical protein
LKILHKTLRLGPGEMLSVNLRNGQLNLNNDLKSNIAKLQPYNEWIEKSVISQEREPFNKG